MLKLTFILALFTLVSCGNSQLIVSDKLTLKQKKSWRIALEFPKYCSNGTYEWLDETSPIMYFVKAKHGVGLVYNVCERYAYQDLVNIFKLENNKNKPRLITFPVPELEQSTVRYIDNKGNTLKYPSGVFKIKVSNLILQRDIKILPSGNIHVVRHFSGTGTCGTLTTYEIKTTRAHIVEFRAQINCENKQKNMRKWPAYKISCPNEEQNYHCQVQKLK